MFSLKGKVVGIMRGEHFVTKKSKKPYQVVQVLVVDGERSQIVNVRDFGLKDFKQGQSFDAEVNVFPYQDGKGLSVFLKNK